MSETTIAQIRAQYPAPLSARTGSEFPTDYCVGTALCRFYGYTVENFVGEQRLAHLLAEINPALDGPPEDDTEENVPPLAWQYATAITAHNDARDFEAAWQVAEEALTARRAEETP